MTRDIGNLLWKFDGYMSTIIVDGGTCGKNLTWKLIDEVIVISGKGDMEDYDYRQKSQWNYSNRNFFRKVIIEEKVTSIGDCAFMGCEHLEEIIIPNSVKKIGEYAFYNCKSLTTLKISDNIKRIGKGAFFGCKSLTVLSGTCGENVTYTINCDGTLTISGNGEMEDYRDKKTPWNAYRFFIESVVIEYGVTSIGESAFSWCQNLKTITISDSVTTIGDAAFIWCTYLTGIKFPNSVETIGALAFVDCKRLTEIKIPESVISIGESVFAFCINLRKIYYPSSSSFEKILSAVNYAKLIPYESLRWKFDGKTLTVGGVRMIKDFSREKPPWLDRILDIQKIIVEEGVEKISANAFIDCKRLELLTIPASVKTIGDMAFTACFCGNRFENGSRNVFWCVEDGVLVFKKNPAAKSDADFSTGSVSWLPVEKNITGFKLEPGVVPKEKFFEWLSKRGNALQASFA